MAKALPRFPPDALTFLRALHRNNDREWFKARKARYDSALREPMIALIEQLALDFRSLAPELVATPKASLYRIYRDTRFSADKTPLKTHVAAVFPHHALARHAGAGLYLELSAAHVLLAGGLYAPQPSDLQRLREHIAARHRQLLSIISAPRFTAAVGDVQGDTLARVPRGFPSDHPAAEFLKRKQWLVVREFPADLALTPRFYPTVLRTFAAIVPLVRFLNAPLADERPAEPSQGRR